MCNQNREGVGVDNDEVAFGGEKTTNVLLLGQKNVLLLGLHTPIAPDLRSHMLPEWKSRGNLTSRVDLRSADEAASRK